MPHSFRMCGTGYVWRPHTPFNFPVELSLLILCDYHTVLWFFLELQTSLFTFMSYIKCCVDCHTFLPLFLSVTLPIFFANVMQIFCVSPLYLCECHLCISSFFVWISHKYSCVSLLLSVNPTLFPFGS